MYFGKGKTRVYIWRVMEVGGVLVKSFAERNAGNKLLKPTYIYLSVQHASKFGFVMDLKEICQLIIKLFGQEDIRENILQKKKSNLIVSESF